jgi:hypothetical protein
LDTPYSVHRGLYGPDGNGSSSIRTEVGAICERSARHWTSGVWLEPDRSRTQKCTEPVAPSSGFPTDRRRSDCRSGSHQPWTLRTRCIAHSRGASRARQGIQNDTSRKLRCFLYTTAMLRLAVCALAVRKEENGRTRGSGRKSSPSRERFRPPSRRTFRFRVVLLGGLRPTGAPCSAQAETYGHGPVRSRGSERQTCRNLRAVEDRASWVAPPD